MLEAPYRRLMRLYAEKGESQSALAVFEELEQELWEARGEKPSVATQELAQEIERLLAVQPTTATGTTPVRRTVRQKLTASLPTGTVTLLAIRAPDADADLQQLDGLRDEFRRHGGVEIALAPNTGSYLVAFSLACDAPACAAACQLRATRARPCMAVHTTEVALEPDGTYSPSTIEPSLHLLATANPSQILYSETAACVIRHGLNGGLRLRDLGTYRFRDACSAERIFQLDYPGGPEALCTPRCRVRAQEPSAVPANALLRPAGGGEAARDPACRRRATRDARWAAGMWKDKVGDRGGRSEARGLRGTCLVRAACRSA